MEPNWSEAKKVALWNYDELMEKILKVLSYKFVQEHYNHSMKEAADYATRPFGYDAKYAKKVGMLTEFFKKLDSLKVKNYVEFARQTETKEKCRVSQKDKTVFCRFDLYAQLHLSLGLALQPLPERTH